MRLRAHDGKGLVDIDVLARGDQLHVHRWTLAPGVTEGLHSHGHDAVGEEAYVVLTGTLVLTRGQQDTVLGPGDCVLLAPDETRGLRNETHTDAVLLVLFTTPAAVPPAADDARHEAPC